MRLVLQSMLLLTMANAFAQPNKSNNRFLEAGVLFGLINYSGDLAESQVELSETKFGAGVFTRYHFLSHVALKATFFTGMLSGTDAHANDPLLKARSLQFNSNILELSLTGEWNFLNIKPIQNNGIRTIRIVPFLYLGVGGLIMQPEVEYFGPPEAFSVNVQYSLPEQGLHKKALTVPFGGGLRAQITDRITVGAEGGWSPALSDHLDGVSLNGNPKRKDWFYSAFVTLSVSLTQPGKMGANAL